MRKSLVIAMLFLGHFTMAQVHQHAIGLRGGGGYLGYGPEISYQLGTSDMNRFEFDLGWGRRRAWNNGIGWGSYGYRAMAFTAMYHWVWNIDGGLNWYVGPGAGLFFVNFDKPYDADDGIYLNIGGQIGLEYDFSEHGVPFNLGLDYRPMFLFNWGDDFGHGAALSLRYLID